MYVAHPHCSSPEKEDAKTWRYLNLEKLTSIFEQKSLYFSSLDTFEDPLEGFLTKATVEQYRKLVDTKSGTEKEELAKIIEHNLRSFKEARNLLYVSCWHLNEHESAAMWKLYSNMGNGIALQSTFAKLKASFNNEKGNVMIGKVNYITEEMLIKQWNLLNIVLHKRMSYKFEEELRIVFMHHIRALGYYITIEPDVLIEKIFIAPNADAKFVEQVKHLVEVHSYNIPVQQSDILSGRLY